MNRRHIAVLLAGGLALAACQDHHFVPMEEADKIKLPTGQQVPAPQGFSEGPQEQKQVMAEAMTKGYGPRRDASPQTVAGDVIVEGKIELGAAQKKRDLAGFTVYVIVRPKNLKGPPVAAARYDAPKFPLVFRLGSSDLMMGAPPAPGDKVMVEVRLNKNPDPMVRVSGDVWGITLEPAVVGSRNLLIVADQDYK